MKYAVWALVGAAWFSLCSVARADQTRVGGALLLVNGTHAERGATATGVLLPAPMLFIDHASKRWVLHAEGIVGIGPQRVGNSGYGLQSVSLSYVGASARYALTPTTALGIGETLYNQRSIYQESGFNETDSSRLAGAQYLVVQSLRRSTNGALDLTLAYNPHMTANLFRSFSNVPFEIVDAESGTQLDTMLAAHHRYRHTTLSYGIRYINLTMHFVNGSIADRNTFLMPFIGLSTNLGG